MGAHDKIRICQLEMSNKIIKYKIVLNCALQIITQTRLRLLSKRPQETAPTLKKGCNFRGY